LEVRRRLATTLHCQPVELDRRLERLGTERAQRVRERLRGLVRAQPAPVRCLGCGYALRGGQKQACPECHKPIPPWQQRAVAVADAAEDDGGGEAQVGAGVIEHRKLEKECAALLAWAQEQAKELAREQG
jgi:hypothetical protein